MYSRNIIYKSRHRWPDKIVDETNEDLQNLEYILSDLGKSS